jgi:ribosomal protein L3 glutamine methyltransferase
MLHDCHDSRRLLTIRDFIRWSASQLLTARVYFGHGMDNAFDEARFLVYQALSLPPDTDNEWLSSAVTIAEAEQIQRWLNERIETRRPAAYITGSTWYAGMRFLVNEQVLVPRSPFAELIARSFDDWVDVNRCERVLDLCTGSGCIGIASLQALPVAEVDLVDISSEALAVAEQNITLHGLGERVRAIHSDVFNALAGQRYDLILCNPPYVDAQEIAAMPKEYQHEPILGLAAGQDGLDLVRRILAQAADYLTEDGVLMVEVGASDEALMAAYPDVPFYWFDFELGGMGVFALNRSELITFADELLAQLQLQA